MAERQKNGRCPHLFEIGIIGGTRGMGEWFARFFEKEGYGVQVSGRNNGMGAREMADHCKVVIVSVPMGVTRKVIEEIGSHMPEDALLMDLTSLKSEPVQAMLDSSVSEVIGRDGFHRLPRRARCERGGAEHKRNGMFQHVTTPW